MTPIERADRIHDCVQDVYWIGRAIPELARTLIEIDIHIHKIIEDYERRGMRHADETDGETTAPTGAAETSDGVGPTESSVRGSGHLW